MAELYQSCVEVSLNNKHTVIHGPRRELCPGVQFQAGPVFLPAPTPPSQMEIRVGGNSLPCPGSLFLTLYLIISYFLECFHTKGKA